MKDNPDVVSAQDYTTLFNSLIVDPLKDRDLLFLSPVLVVIDALDESEDASITSSNRIPFHTFLGQHLSELPSNFRILITCRPEAGILDAFPASLSVRHMQMDDPDLSSGIDEDIRTYLRTSLSGTSVDENELYELTRKAERLFQWPPNTFPIHLQVLIFEGALKGLLNQPKGKVVSVISMHFTRWKDLRWTTPRSVKFSSP